MGKVRGGGWGWGWSEPWGCRSGDVRWRGVCSTGVWWGMRGRGRGGWGELQVVRGGGGGRWGWGGVGWSGGVGGGGRGWRGEGERER